MWLKKSDWLKIAVVKTIDRRMFKRPTIQFNLIQYNFILLES